MTDTSKPNESDMWGCMFASDLALMKVSEKVIILLGY
jgi:hypothetical protein